MARLRTAAEAFLDTIGSANTRRAYGIAIVRPSTGSTAARTDSPPPAAPWTRSPTPQAENLRRYFKPSPQAIRELTSILGPGAERRR